MLADPRLVRRENIAQALGGISPWDPRIGQLNTLQAELLVHWRLPVEEGEDKAILEADAKHTQLADEAMYGAQKRQPDELQQAANQGFDFIEIDDE